MGSWLGDSQEPFARRPQLDPIHDTLPPGPTVHITTHTAAVARRGAGETLATWWGNARPRARHTAPPGSLSSGNVATPPPPTAVSTRPDADTSTPDASAGGNANWPASKMGIRESAAWT